MMYAFVPGSARSLQGNTLALRQSPSLSLLEGSYREGGRGGYGPCVWQGRGVRLPCWVGVGGIRARGGRERGGIAVKYWVGERRNRGKVWG